MRAIPFTLGVLAALALLAAPLGPLSPAGTAEAVVCTPPPEGDPERFATCTVWSTHCLALALKAYLLKEDPVHCPA